MGDAAALMTVLRECSSAQERQRTRIEQLEERCASLSAELRAARDAPAPVALAPPPLPPPPPPNRSSSASTSFALVLLSALLCAASAYVEVSLGPAIWISCGVCVTLAVEAVFGGGDDGGAAAAAERALVVRDASAATKARALLAPADAQRWRGLCDEMGIVGGGGGGGGDRSAARKQIQDVCDRADALELANKPLPALRILLGALSGDFDISDADAEALPAEGAVLPLPHAALAAVPPSNARLLVNIGRAYYNAFRALTIDTSEEISASASMAPTMAAAYTHGHAALTRALAIAPPSMPAPHRAELHLWHALLLEAFSRTSAKSTREQIDMGHSFHEHVLLAIRASPQHPLAHLSLGIFLLSVTKKVPPVKRAAAGWLYGRQPPPASFEEALVELEAANALYPASIYGRRSITALMLEGECHAALGDVANARRRYSEAAAVPPFVSGDAELVAQAHAALAKL